MASLPDERRAPMKKLRAVIRKHLPRGFTEQMSYGMLGYVVPHSRYPAGYHCDPSLPLPFINLASQKNHIALYHMAIYGDPVLSAWFKQAYAEQAIGKLDSGKSCIRFKRFDAIPYGLIGELCSKVSVDDCIDLYERERR